MSKKAEHLPKMKIRAADDPNGKYVEKRVYKMRRLPQLSRQSTEMEDVRSWIRFALSKHVLGVSETDAYDIIREVIDTHLLVEGQSAYVGYPAFCDDGRAQETPHASHAAENQTVSPESIIGSDSARNALVETNSTGENHHGSSETQDEQSSMGENQQALQGARTARTSTLEHQEPSLSVLPSLSSSQELVPAQYPEDTMTYLNITDKVVATAENDDLFLFLCKVEDDSSDCMVGMVAARLMDKLEQFQIQECSILMDVLQYAYGKHFGTKSAQEHYSRKNRIRLNVHMLKLARSWLGKPTYEQMEWKSSSNIVSSINSQVNAIMSNLQP